jgi:tetratricopeptide (TPR) repeat protein
MIAANSAAYNLMKTEIYPKLRRTDYQLDFEVAPISIERGKEIMHTNPRNLSLNEMFLIGETYQPGSEEFRDVMEIAARTFPDSDVANINAASAAIARGDYVSAASFLNKVHNHDADWSNNMGIVAFMQGDVDKAVEYFTAAGDKATANVAELEKYFDSLPQ